MQQLTMHAWIHYGSWSEISQNQYAQRSYDRAARAAARRSAYDIMHAGTDIAAYAMPDINCMGTLDIDGSLTSLQESGWPKVPSLTCFVNLHDTYPRFSQIRKSQTAAYVWTVFHTPWGKFVVRKGRNWQDNDKRYIYRKKLINGISPDTFVKLLRRWNIHALWIQTTFDQDQYSKVRFLP